MRRPEPPRRRRKFSHRFKLFIAPAMALLPGRLGVKAQVRLEGRDAASRQEAAIAEFERRLAALAPGDLCIDLGANVGEATEEMLAAGAVVHAFEPDPWTFARLSERVGAMPGAHLHNNAAGARAQSAEYVRHPAFEADPAKWSQGGTIAAGSHAASPEGQRITIDCIDFSAFLLALDRPARVVKMDIEGSEFEVLDHLFATGAIHRIEALFIETHLGMMPHERGRLARLRRQAAALEGVYINFDWP